MRSDGLNTENRGRLEDTGGRPSNVAEEQRLASHVLHNMLAKLRENRGKRHWRDPEVLMSYLFGRLREEVAELERAVYADDPLPAEVWREVADVANIAAMIADRCERGVLP